MSMGKIFGITQIDGPGHEEDSSEVFTDDLLGLGESCWLKQHSQANMGIGGAELDPLDQGLDDLSALASLTLGNINNQKFMTMIFFLKLNYLLRASE